MAKRNDRPKADELFFSKTKDYSDAFLSSQIPKSEQTRRAYQNSLSDFFDYISEKKGLSPLAFKFSDCTYDFVLEYLEYLQKERHLAPVTVNQRLTAIKQYLKYVAGSNFEVTQVYLTVSQVPSVSVPKVIRPIIKAEDLPAFLNAPPDTRIGTRDRMILALLFDTAVRVSELTAITLGDIRVSAGRTSILIHGKGRKERIANVSDGVARNLAEYLSIYHSGDEPPETPLFYTVIHGVMNRMTARNVERIVDKYGDVARRTNPDIPDTYPHILRRTRATLWYRDGVPLPVISSILGHEEIETTRIYAIPSAEQLRDAVKSASDPNPEQKPLWKDSLGELKRQLGLK